ncbi:MAG: type III CRISPR-associated RAMP protein Csx7 [bacterium]
MGLNCATFDVLKRKVILRGYVEVLSSLHIGKGRALAPDTPSDNPVIKDFLGRPFIPGSSLKGSLRSIVESFVRAYPHSSLKACDVLENPCINDREKPSDEQLLKKSCDVCLLFGSPWVASRLSFIDLPIIDETRWHELLLQVRDGVAIDREAGIASPQRKYDYEIVPAGARFKLEILCENVEDYELGLLFTAFELLNKGFAHLGGHSSRGCGRVRVEIESCEDIKGEEIMEVIRGVRKEVKFEDFKKRCIEALEEKLKGGGKG